MPLYVNRTSFSPISSVYGTNFLTVTNGTYVPFKATYNLVWENSSDEFWFNPTIGSIVGSEYQVKTYNTTVIATPPQEGVDFSVPVYSVEIPQSTVVSGPGLVFSRWSPNGSLSYVSAETMFTVQETPKYFVSPVKLQNAFATQVVSPVSRVIYSAVKDTTVAVNPYFSFLKIAPATSAAVNASLTVSFAYLGKYNITGYVLP